MSKITAIENAIIQLGSAEFQKFCDTFLSCFDKYGMVHGFGMQSGTSKTTIGNPDTYFRKENGKYVFVAYTTQQNSIYSKIKEDIDKCLNYSKTGIKVEDIDEIICCHTSSNLSAGEDKELHNYCEEYGITLTIFGVDEIAQRVYHDFPKLSKDFLHVPVDSNQIMSAEDFIDAYNSNTMAAPLNTVFVNREKELSYLQEAIKDNSVIIIHGEAGVGKTRIVLEATRQYAKINNCRLLCVKNRNKNICDDIIYYIKTTCEFIFFVDDANELIDISSILEYINKKNQGYNVKVVLTVREYAKEAVIIEVKKYTKPYLFKLIPFKDDEIKLFLNKNMNIYNEEYVSQIIRIAEGNIRIAYMAGKLAKESQSLKAIYDVTELYENYYASVIKKKLRDDRDLCLTMGIMALLRIVILDRLDNLEPVLVSIGMTSIEFKKKIDELSIMEFVEINSNKVAFLSDQCLANYMLYYVFFKKKLIVFSKILEIGFKYFRKGVLYGINTVLNLFTKEELQRDIVENVKTVWEFFKNNNDVCYDDFVKSFHTVRPEESFCIVNEKIEKIETRPFSSETIDFNNNIMNSDDNILSLMTGYYHSDYMNFVIDLLMLYVEKSEENAICGYNWFKDNYGITHYSLNEDFYTEVYIQKELARYINSSELCQRFILKYISYALDFEFRPVEWGRGNSITQYNFKITISEGVKEYRKLCWNNMNNLLHNSNLTKEIYNLLLNYSESISRVNSKEICEFDANFIKNIIFELSCSNLKKAKIIDNLQSAYKRFNLDYNDKEHLLKTEEWKLYTLLKYDYFSSKISYEDYNEMKKKELCEYAKNISDLKIPIFIKTANIIFKELEDGSAKNYNLIEGMQNIVDFMSNDKYKAEITIKALMDFASDIRINPSRILQTLFAHYDALYIWNLISSREFLDKNTWEYYYFQQIPANMVTKEIYEILLSYLRNDSDKELRTLPYRDLRFVEKFFIEDKNVYVTVSKIIYEKREYNSLIVDVYFYMLFVNANGNLENLINIFNSDKKLLRKIYFFMLENHKYFDFKGELLDGLLKINDLWIYSYADLLSKKMNNGWGDYREQFKTLWLSDNYERYYDIIFHSLIEKQEKFYTYEYENTLGEIMLCCDDNDTIIKKQNEWVLRNVRECAHNNSVTILFSGLLKAKKDIRINAVVEFLRHNDSYEDFQKIPLDSDMWGGSFSEIISKLKNRIEYLSSLLIFTSKKINYIHHQKRIKDRIDMWKKEIKDTELRNMCMGLYQ